MKTIFKIAIVAFLVYTVYYDYKPSEAIGNIGNKVTNLSKQVEGGVKDEN